MPEIRETEVARDSEGRVVGYRERLRAQSGNGGGFAWGLVLGVLLILIGIGAFAYQRGSFQTAGAAADRVTAEAQAKLSELPASDDPNQSASTSQTSQQ
ncbi:MAG TPA: hypothetical protein VG841_05960 [Caulobacterales bacterium]|nr:hypothetical protein [Caulobacterales bacterium]